MALRASSRASAPRPAPGAKADRPTLAYAFREAAEHRWRSQRSGKRNISQCLAAIVTLERIVQAERGRRKPAVRKVKADGWTFEIRAHPRPPGRRVEAGDTLTTADVTEAHLLLAVKQWLGDGLAPATVHVRLTALSVLGVTVGGTFPRLPRKPKWWLRPEQQAKAIDWLRGRPGERYAQLADFIEFVTLTGLRVEEALRLTWSDIVVRPTRTVVAVPGTKSRAAQRSLPVSADAAAVLERRRELHPTLVFHIPYHQLATAWREVRERIGLENPREATLKAFRRNAARNLTVNGMPTAVLKDYLGHERVETTMGYLRLTGGFAEEEFAKWL